MVNSVSTLGLQLITINNLKGGQEQLSSLSQQLTTGKYSTDLADYSSAKAQKLLNMTSRVDVEEGFLTVIDTIIPYVEAYDSSMNGIEDSISAAYSTFLSYPTYDVDENAALASAIQGYVEDMVYYLNQTVGERYIFAGSRYNQVPVISAEDFLAQPLPPSSTTPVAPNAVPSYDSDYDSLNPTAAVPEAYAEITATIDTSKSLTYGVSSNEDGFQQIMLGLQWAYAATQDPANYQTYMTTAQGLLTEGLSNVRAVHTGVTNDYSTLLNTSDMIGQKVSSLSDQIDNIEAVDPNEVGVKISVLQAQLEAAYAVTAKIISLSLLNYI